MTPAEREARILSLETLVQQLSKIRMRTLPFGARLDDIVSAAWVGAIQAVDRFDPARHVSLEAFAKWRICGEIVDYLRSLDHLSRGHRNSVKLADEHRRRVGQAEIQEPPLLSLQPVVLSMDAKFICDDQEIIPDTIPDERARRERERHDARLQLEVIYRRAQLRPRSARVLRRYMEGETMILIGKAEGINESRVSQICSQAISKLRAAA